ncbi:Cdc15p [Rhizophagus irregularis DAOM 197198w]|uniref:Cdc15p n=3 Tax=Rhizophagus irregularis TaxID=588596 RepID=A0A015ITV4_RHIIW|nr:Cdc15p [Rhizophagus irregularis DAOM 197198w]
MSERTKLLTKFGKFFNIISHGKKVLCEECKQGNTEDDWCKACNAKHFQQNFENWTSGNDDIDKFIQDTQLSANTHHKVLEWIPYDRFYDIEYIAKGGFGRIYKAKWIDGYILNWDNTVQNWKRLEPNKFVALKSLDNSKNTSEILNEISLHKNIFEHDQFIVKFYGITQDPKTKDYIMVLDYAEKGNLRNYLSTDYNKLDWNAILRILLDVASGLDLIHEKELIHRDLHVGNILMSSDYAMITDFGLCKPADNVSENKKNHIYGVLPYIAPEILRGQNYTKAADIYSFGIIMYEAISGLPPYHDLSNDENLAIKICQGLRPRFKIKVPQLIVHLVKKCLDENPSNRPTSEEIKNILYIWCHDFNNQTELKKQIEEAEEINYKYSAESISPINLGLLSYKSNKTRSEAIYTSRLINFNKLPEPKNSDDYYEHYDNIVSEKISDSQLGMVRDRPKTSNDYYKQNNIIMSQKFSVKYDHSKPNSILLKSSIIKKIIDHETEEVVQVQVTDKVAKIQRKSTIIKNNQQDESVKTLSNQLKDNDDTTNKLKQNEKKIEVLRNKLDEETKKYQDSLEKITALNNQIKNRDDDINKLLQRTVSLEGKLNEEIMKYEASQDKFISQFKDRDVFIDLLQKELNEKTGKCQVSEDNLTALKNQLKNKEFIEELQSKLDEEIRKCQDYSSNLKNKEELNEKLQNKLNEETRKCQDCLDKLKNKEKIIEELQSQMENFKKETTSAFLSRIQTQHIELSELVNYVGKKHDFDNEGWLLMDNILEKQRNAILTNDNFASEELEIIRQKLIDYGLTEEEIRDILHKQAEKTKLDMQLKSIIQGESSSLNIKNDQSNERAKNLLSKQQIIQKFKLNHGLFLDGYSIKASKKSVYIEDGKLNISLCKEQPFLYTFINDRDSQINLLSFNSKNNDVNNIKINKSLQLLDMCINFPVAEITYTADLSESFESFMDDNEVKLYEMYGHLFPRKILIGGKLFIDDLKSATSTQIDMFKSFLTWVYDSAKYKKTIPFNNFTALKFFPKITTSDGENLNTYDKLTNWMNNLYQKNSDIIISYNNLVPISELRFGKSSSSVNEMQPGVTNFKEKISLREWVKDSIYINLTRWIKEFCLFQGQIINKHLELENSKKTAVNFINVPNVNSSDKLYLEMIKPITTLEDFFKSNNVNKFLNKDMTLLPFIKNSIHSVNLSYEDYTHFMIKCERYRILLSKADIKPSEEFEQAIENALENMKPFTFLQDVFDNYGYFYPLNIVLGKSLKNILPNSSLPFTFKKMESSFESLAPFFDNFNVSYFLTKKGSIIEKDDLPKWIQSINNDLEIIEFDNIISLYDILKEEQQRSINIILNTQNNNKIIMTGIVDLEDLNIDNTEHYKRININPSFENGKYEVFGSIISNNKKENLKSEFFIRFGLYDPNGFSAMIKTLNKNSEINITECYILWMITGIPSELLVFSPRNRELPVNRIKEPITLRNDDSDSNYSIEISHQLSQGDIVSINIHCSTTNYEPINVKLIGWSKNRINFQILKPIYNNSNLNNSTSSIASSDDGEDSTDSLSINEEAIIIDICVCILSSEYKSLKIDNKEKGCHSCNLNLIGYTLTEENFNEKLSIAMMK